MATPNPMETTYNSDPPHISTKVFTIAGILTTVYGLDEIPSSSTQVACLYLLHPRLQTQVCMEPLARSTIHAWNQRLRSSSTASSSSPKGLIAVSFDQRNHGTREVSKIANEAWRQGNETHAQDMFSIYHGTAMDTSLLMNYVSSYAFPHAEKSITQNLALGISLGGHAAWHCVLHEPRISAAVVIIGCPDYTRLMSDRARLSKLQTYVSSEPAGSGFLGSKDFPKGLVEAVEQYDPAGLLLGQLDVVTAEDHLHEPSDREKERLILIMKEKLAGKRILNMAGGADKLVPYAAGEPFLTWLKKAIAKDGWFSGSNVVLEDKIFDGVGHEVPQAMVKEAVRFVCETLEAGDDSTVQASRSSKI